MCAVLQVDLIYGLGVDGRFEDAEVILFISRICSDLVGKSDRDWPSTDYSDYVNIDYNVIGHKTGQDATRNSYTKKSKFGTKFRQISQGGTDDNVIFT